MEPTLFPAADQPPLDMVRTELAALRQELQSAIRQSRITITGDKALLFEALAKAQADFTEIRRTEHAHVKTRDGSSYSFSYAPLENVLAATVPALNRHGLWFSQPLSSNDNGGHQLRTWLCHSSGAMIEVETDIPGAENIQKLGSAITYLRRYVAQALLGVSAEEDDDGNAADGNQRTRLERPAARPAPSSAPPPRPAPSPAPQTRQEAPPAAQTTTKPQGTVSSHGDDRAAAAGVITQGTPKTEPSPTPGQVTREPEGILPEQDIELGQLFKSLKYSRTAAGDFVRKACGRGPAELTRADADKLIPMLRKMVADLAAPQGAAS